MSRRPARALAVILGVVLLSPIAVAAADHHELEMDVGVVSELGEMVELRVTLRDADSGTRIPHAMVVATRQATIAGVTGDVELARATTDELGVARLRWQQRVGVDHTVVVAYAAPGEAGFEFAEIEFAVIGSERQIHRSTAGVKIPGFGAWVLIGLIVVVWGIIQFTLLGPMLVARRFEAVETDDASGGSS